MSSQARPAQTAPDQITAGQSAPPQVHPEPDPRRWLALPVVLTAMFMAQFDLYVVNVAAPSLQRDLGAGPAALELIVAGYGFSYASGLVTGGRLGDLVGSRRMFLVGTVAFTIASLFCGLAQSPGQLVAGRLIQGLTGAAMVPQVLALISGIFPAAERSRALSWFGVTVGIGAVAGQVLGGGLLQLDLFGLGWRVIFLVNLPIGLAAAALALRLLPSTRPTGRTQLDPLGALGVSLSLGLVLAPLILGRTEGWPLWTWLSLAASVPVLLLSLRWERTLARRGGQPMLELSLFRNVVFRRGLVVCLCVFGAFMSFMFSLTLVLQSGLGLTPFQAGIAFCPLGLSFVLASLTAPRFTGRYGARLVPLGAAIAGLGVLGLLITLIASGQNFSVGRLLVPLALIGLGNGVAIPVVTGAVIFGARTQHAGAAAGILTTTQQFAAAAGVAVLGTVFFQVLGNGSGVADYASALAWVAAIALVLVIVAGLTSLLLPGPKQLAAQAQNPQAQKR